MSIRVRIAPSPTGLLHIGTVRTALFNYLFARKNGGTFILRIEDTDKERSTKEAEETILSGLTNLGITPDEGPEQGGDFGPYRQSERTYIYKPYIEKLIDEGKAYYCFCTKEHLDGKRNEARQNKLPFRYDGTCRNISKDEAEKRIQNGEKAVIRLNIPDNEEIAFSDIVRGDTKQNTKDLTGDMVIAKNIDNPLYNFVVVIDDYLMKISHVIRGEDHLSNTPKQIIIYKALGFEIPKFAHLPLILNADKTKLSKRKNSVCVDDYLDDGYMKEAMINFLGLLGWNDGTEKEIFSLKELENNFSLERVSKAGAVFDLKKLDWLNKQYIKNLSDTEVAQRIIPQLIEQGDIEKINDEKFIITKTKDEITLENIAFYVHHEKERISKISEMPDCLSFYFIDILKYEKELLIPKKTSEDEVKIILKNLIETLENTEDFSEENLRNVLIEKIQEWGLKNGQVLWPMRAALTGKERSPGAFEVANTLGKEKSLKRLKVAVEKL